MNIPKLGEVLAEVQDTLKLEHQVTKGNRKDIAEQLADARADMIGYISQTMDSIALQLDTTFGERAEKLEELINGGQQKTEITDINDLS